MVIFKEYYENLDDLLNGLELTLSGLKDLMYRYSVGYSGVDYEHSDVVVPGMFSDGMTMMLLLYSGAYGDFPIPSEIRGSLSEREKKRLNLDRDAWEDFIDCLEYESGIASSELSALNSQPTELQNPRLSYKELYSVVWFLMCLREELVKATLFKRGIRYNPLMQFENAMHFQKGSSVNWSTTNNVILACTESIIATIALFLNYTLLFNNVAKYNFICASFSLKDLSKLPGFQCVKTWRARSFLYKVLTYILNSVQVFSQSLRRLANIKQKFSFSEYFFKPSMESLVQKIFIKVSKMEDYIMYI